MQRIKKLYIHTTQGYAGELARESQFVFNYRSDRPETEISLTMPLRSKSYSANILPGAIRQNLPEGFLKDWIVEHFAKVTKMDDMTVLAISGREVIGRVRSLMTENENPTEFRSESLSDILSWKGTEDLFDHLANQYALASGISGIQPKVLVASRVHEANDSIDKVSMKNRSLIIKSSGFDYPDLAENEFNCMSIARKAGLQTPNFWLSDDKKLFVIERFDLSEEGYLGFEDMTSLMNKQNEDKYNSSYEDVAKAIGLFASPAHVTESLLEFFKSVTLSLALRNGDAHLKNFGLLYTNPQTEDCRLSPLYDVVNTTSYIPTDSLALKLNKTKSWPTRQDLIDFGQTHCRLQHASEIVDQIVDVAQSWTPAENSTIWDLMKPQIDKACFTLTH